MRRQNWLQKWWFNLGYWERVRRQGLLWSWFVWSLLAITRRPFGAVASQNEDLVCAYMREHWFKEVSYAVIVPVAWFGVGQLIWRYYMKRGYVTPDSINKGEANGLQHMD